MIYDPPWPILEPSPVDPMSDTLSVPAVWTNDCQGKKDFDGKLVTLSTRYWPRGGGFSSLTPHGWKHNDARPEIKPSAHATIFLGSTDDGFYTDAVPLVEAQFEADDEYEVTAQVEAWAKEQYRRITDVLTREFLAVKVPSDGEVTMQTDGK